ncbi:hypothetical protein BOX15_Mlig017414g4, partial [Macrostomum lignano]
SGMSVLIETSLGDITVDLYCRERPRCCENFLKLCKVKYYNWCLFHSVQRGLVAQTGDPTGSGSGGEAVYAMLGGEKYFDRELRPKMKHLRRGCVSMVNSGSDRHGSQFFITLGDSIDSLDGVHTVFGQVAEGFDILDKLNEVYCDRDHRPFQDVRIYHTIVLDDPFPDPPGLVIPDRSPEPSAEQLARTDRIGAEDAIDDTEGLTQEEAAEYHRQREAQSNARLLAMIGDLPDEDVKPPDNVLFVCKLNPVTTDDDLNTIFSRFGEIHSCEVIRSKRTGESLQYAFIEFDKADDCEAAYFKMDNVLIDDRRIHVDFCQSVAKVWRDFRRDKATAAAGKRHSQQQQRRRSPSPAANNGSRNRRSPSPDQQQRSRNRRSPSPDQQRSRNRRSPSPDQQQRSRNRRSPSSDQQQRSRNRRSPSSDQQQRSRNRRSPSPDQQQRSRNRRSPSPKQQQRSRNRRSPSPEQQHRYRSRRSPRESPAHKKSKHNRRSRSRSRSKSHGDSRSKGTSSSRSRYR